jgi:CRISPR system Cascade subunit CasC
MKRFVQLHILTFYPPANLNRDDTGRPKTAFVGGVERLRVSSQSIKRAVRTSDVFRVKLAGHLGERTQRFGEEIETHLLKKGITAEIATKTARTVAGAFGKIVPEADDHPTRIAQLAFISPQEQAAAFALAEDIAAAGNETAADVSALLLRIDTAADVAMFGRMLAEKPNFNREAAVQVAHAITTHRVAVEDDFYTAVDDLKIPAEDAGAAFVGELGFGSGIFYLYVCIDRSLLVKNLAGEETVAAAAIGALVEALATVSPRGKQATFASRARASYILAERGDGQPRTLAGAFLKPVRGEDLMRASSNALKSFREKMDAAYGPSTDEPKILDVETGAGSLADIVSFVTG